VKVSQSQKAKIADEKPAILNFDNGLRTYLLVLISNVRTTSIIQVASGGDMKTNRSNVQAPHQPFELGEAGEGQDLNSSINCNTFRAGPTFMKCKRVSLFNNIRALPSISCSWKNPAYLAQSVE